ncbi:MAG: transketolase [Synergistaceae bacterium]|jgi:transketolase|nr:transketolase [Synergistaceae bacterium]
MDDARRSELEGIALDIRKDVVRMAGVSKSSGLLPALTVVELLVYLYWEFMRIFPGQRNNPERDRLVLSSVSAAPALYACLSSLGFFDRDELWSYRRLGGMLQGYPDIRTPGIDAPGGTNGLGIALGLALQIRMAGLGGRVFCVMGEGEPCGDGLWESIDAAAVHAPGNIFMIMESAGEPGGEMEAEAPLLKRLASFGWKADVADGRDFASIERAFRSIKTPMREPAAIIALTGGSRRHPDAFESKAQDRPPSLDDVERALSELDTKAGKRGGAA